MRKATKGFTLIELLVVISIIALLMGIIVPALSRVKLSAQTLICSTNLKNYGTALQGYAQDNNHKAPFAVYWLYSRRTLNNGACASGCRWHYTKDWPDGSFWPYVADKNVHMCPTFKTYALREGCSQCGAPETTTVPFNPMYSYSMNYFLGFDWETGLRITFSTAYEKEVSLKLTRVTRPAQCFAFSEENLWTLNIDNGYRENYSRAILNDNALWMAPNPGRSTDNIATYHNVNLTQKNEGKANLVFVDGHVETMRGLPEEKAYLQYAKPYQGHENLNPIW
ncbi:MAG TPA: type II secretion system protein [Anaerohalosphaeraceae bacterium]|nr:type II secretion system protein [Anaerohalosphaeraceae bacterium]HPP55127.1 type II secretion system protein [Anaerohalosphaeraceae bacterium]